MTKKLLTLNQTQFAKHLSVDKSYVTQLKQAERLVFAENGLVDVEASMQLIAETADPGRYDVKNRHAEARKKETKTENIGKVYEKTSEKKAKLPVVHSSNQTRLTEGRALEQEYKALAAKRDYEVSMGLLVSLVDVNAAFADVTTSFRQRLENQPHSISPELVGQPLDEIQVRLKHANHEILIELSREFAAKIKNVSEQQI